jgi:4-amino-4-deoxy-L-arabinose transferase-like glycosyltransferase
MAQPGAATPPATERRSRPWGQIQLVTLAAAYAGLALASALTLQPWCDEAWFSSPALNLISKGHMGTSVLDPTASWRSVQLEGIDRRTYWIMPFYVLAQSAWYRLVGFGLFPMRALSIVSGLAALAAWFVIVRALAGDRRVALAAAALLAVDGQFLWSASVGRMDMMTAALAFGAIAAYLGLRERHFGRALLAGHGLCAAGVLTHPVGVLGAAGLLFLMLYMDRKRLRAVHLALAAAPYAAGAAAWGWYIAQDAALFRAQFGGNASDRWLIFTSPLAALWKELVERYGYSFGLAPDAGGAARVKALALAGYAAGVAGALLTRRIRQDRGYRALIGLGLVYGVGLLVLDGFKQRFYLVHTLPFLATALAAWLIEGRLRRGLAAVIAGGVVVVQLGVTMSRVAQDRYRNVYLPAAAYLKEHAGAPGPIMGSAEFAFELGFDGKLVDDFRLGYRSGKRPDLIVVDDQRYAEWIAKLKEQDPGNYAYARKLLADEFRLVYERGSYRIYGRPHGL